MFGILGLFLSAKNASAVKSEPECKMGEYNKWLHCDSCKWTAKEIYKNKTVCPECGSEDLTKVVGRWNHKIVNLGYTYYYSKFEFIPRETM